MPSPPDPVAFELFGLAVRWYALFMLAGVVAGIALTRFVARRTGLDPDWVLDAAPWIVLAAIVGARLYYVFLRGPELITRPLEAINIRLGGLSFHGGLIAAAIALYLLCHFRKQPFLAWADAAVPGAALAQAIGRWGNWANQEAFGAPTSLPWGLWISPDRRPAEFLAADRFHPTFLYESLFNLANALVLTWLALRVPHSRRLRHGDVFALYLITYGLARFLIERLRTDSLYLGPLPAAYWLSWAFILTGASLLLALRLVHRAPDDGDSTAPVDYASRRQSSFSLRRGRGPG
jgi:phosphatidylglycerol:prolipoprotein diacylglycerol transferase